MITPLLRSTAVALLPLVLVNSSLPVLAQSIIPAPDGTATLVLPNGTHFTITGGQFSADGTNLFHSFSQFGLTSGEIATFLANPALQNILARVVGGDPSIINGLLQVSGGNPNLVLMNPAGILFGPNASLNVPTSFTATTANAIGFGSHWFNATGPNDYQSLVGSPATFAFFSSRPGSVVNAGNLAVGSGQFLSLLGSSVVSTGSLAAPGGQIIVSAIPGQSLVRLSQPGSPLSLDIQPLSNPNAPPLTPLSLPQLLTAGQATNATGVTVNAQGQVILTGSGLALPSTPETILIAGTIDVSNSNPGQPGGTVAILGQTVGLVDQAQVNASGSAGGGTVLVGGDYLGQGPVPNAQVTYMGPNATVQADALTGGNGGKIIIWSDQTTRTYGTLTARGGPQSGNGGFIETSSKGFLDVQGVPDVSALTGQGGTWLIDPYDITIIASPGTLGSPFTATSANSTIRASDIAIALLSGNVTVSTGTGGSQAGNITMQSGASVFLGAPTTNTMTFQAANNIVLESGASLSLNGGSFTSSSVNFTSAGTINTGQTATLSAIGGNVTIAASGTVNAGTIDTKAIISGGGATLSSRAGNVTITAGSTLSAGAIDARASVNGTGTTFLATGGTVSLRTTPTAGGNIQFTSIDAVSIVSGAGPTSVSTGGTVQITANGLVQGTGVTPSNNFTINTSAIGSGGATRILGTVAITHDGGPSNLPFVIGSTTNGLAGGISTGDNTAITTGTFPVLPNGGTVSAGTNITITSINSPPTLTGTPFFSSFAPGVPVTLTYQDLLLQVADVNSDNLFIVIDQILGGVLLVNGSLVGSGTTLNPGDTLNFIPLGGAFAQAPGFTIRASDNVSVSESMIVPVLQDVGSFDLTEDEFGFFTLDNVQVGTLANLDVMAEIDTSFANEYTDYYDLPPAPPVNLRESQEILASIAAKTGIKPALVYARFIPTGLEASDKQRNPTSTSSQPGDDILWEFNSQGLLTEVLPDRAQPSKILRKELDSDQLELLIITAKGDPVRKRVPGVSRGALLKLAQQFREAVTNPTNDDYLEPAQELYRILVAPLEAQMTVKGIDNLTFLTDSGLRSLPLAALHDGKQFLVEKYSLGLMPSFNLTDTRYVNIQQSKVLAMGASQFPDQSPLPAVPKELSSIAREIWTGRSFLNQNFTVQNLQVQRQRENYGILHLATHGEFRSGSPSNSYIQFWNSKLQLDQIRGLKLNNPPIELLVLSACRTALGDRQAELGFAGLAVQAGVKSALGSLWYVSDEGTLALMTEFYQNLKATPVKAEALRRSQLAMIQGKIQVSNGQLQSPHGTTALPTELVNLPSQNLVHPYYWAAFTLIGNPW